MCEREDRGGDRGGRHTIASRAGAIARRWPGSRQRRQSGRTAGGQRLGRRRGRATASSQGPRRGIGGGWNLSPGGQRSQDIRGAVAVFHELRAGPSVQVGRVEAATMGPSFMAGLAGEAEESGWLRGRKAAAGGGVAAAAQCTHSLGVGSRESGQDWTGHRAGKREGVAAWPLSR